MLQLALPCYFPGGAFQNLCIIRVPYSYAEKHCDFTSFSEAFKAIGIPDQFRACLPERLTPATNLDSVTPKLAAVCTCKVTAI